MWGIQLKIYQTRTTSVTYSLEFKRSIKVDQGRPRTPTITKNIDTKQDQRNTFRVVKIKVDSVKSYCCRRLLLSKVTKMEGKRKEKRLKSQLVQGPSLVISIYRNKTETKIIFTKITG